MAGPPRYDQPSRLAKLPASSSVDDEAESESDMSLDQIDTASTTASGSENRLYLRLALYAGGNILTLLLVLVLWTVWSLLSTFRNPMIWALLCSTALQDIKEDLVVFFKRKLADDRCACCTTSSAMLCRAVPCCAVLHCAVMCSALLCSGDCIDPDRATTELHTSGMLPVFLQECGPDLPFPGLVAVWSHFNKLGRRLEHFCKVEPVCEGV